MCTISTKSPNICCGGHGNLQMELIIVDCSLSRINLVRLQDKLIQGFWAYI